MSTTLEHIRWTLDHGRNCTIHEQKLLLTVAEAAVELQLAEAELNSGSSDIADWNPFEHVRVHKRHNHARAALVAAISPLLEATE